MKAEPVSRIFAVPRRARGNWIGAVVGAVVVMNLAACASPDPSAAVSQLAQDLEAKSVLPQLLGDLTDTPVTVTDTQWSAADGTATATYDWTWEIAHTEWSYTTTAQFEQEDGQWQPVIEPTVIHPQATAQTSFQLTRTQAERGRILSTNGAVLVTARPVYVVGIDKTRVTDAAAQEAAATELAVRVGYQDPASYAATVAAAGAQAFVPAITVRQQEADIWNVDELRQLTGVIVLAQERQLAPTASFARPVLGTVGEATAEIVDESDGTVVAGDTTGIGGLQQQYNELLSGSPELVVSLVGEDDADAVELWRSAAVPGQDLTITIDDSAQLLAEELLADVDGVSALAAVRPSTGEVVALATNGSDWNVAALGGYAPGSTFKVVTALAMLRAGVTAQSVVQCTESLTVDGKEFTNYVGYAPTGDIPLLQAFANSCNTAFIAADIPAAQLAQAAADLGLGLAGSWPFEYYSGTVPADATGTAAAAAAIGQGEVLASPLAMAGVAASVAAGHTVVPTLVSGTEVPVADGLSSTEAEQLAELMRAVVTDGTGYALLDVPDAHAKTGTAETLDAPHAWMIAYRADLAVAVMVEDGTSGAADAGPVVADFLTGFSL